jgi:hypothetical protein
LRGSYRFSLQCLAGEGRRHAQRIEVRLLSWYGQVEEEKIFHGAKFDVKSLNGA